MNRKHKWSAFLAIAMICGSITGCAGTENNSKETVQNSSSIKEESQKSDDKYSDTITLVWYPNESAEDYQGARDEIGRLIEQATGKKSRSEADYRLRNCHRISFQRYCTNRMRHGS